MGNHVVSPEEEKERESKKERGQGKGGFLCSCEFSLGKTLSGCAVVGNRTPLGVQVTTTSFTAEYGLFATHVIRSVACLSVCSVQKRMNRSRGVILH